MMCLFISAKKLYMFIIFTYLQEVDMYVTDHKTQISWRKLLKNWYKKRKVKQFIFVDFEPRLPCPQNQGYLMNYLQQHILKITHTKMKPIMTLNPTLTVVAR